MTPWLYVLAAARAAWRGIGAALGVAWGTWGALLGCYECWNCGRAIGTFVPMGDVVHEIPPGPHDPLAPPRAVPMCMDTLTCNRFAAGRLYERPRRTTTYHYR